MTLDEAIRYEEKIVEEHNKIKRIKAITLEEHTRAEKHRQLAEWLKELKLLREQTRWIPVSEMLPKKGEYGKVLVTYIPSGGTLWTKVMIAHYSDLMGIAKPSFHIGEVGKENFQNITKQVIAWMPLPEPYKVDPQEARNSVANCWECENLNTQMCEGCKDGYMDGIDGWVQFDEPTHFIPKEPQESDHKCHTCKHYTSGENDGSCGSYICKGYSDWESEDKE